MKILYIILFGIFYIPNPPKETVDLKIVVSHIKQIKGTMELALYNKPEVFLEKGKEFKLSSQKVSGSSIVFVFKDIPKDEYAIAVYQDVNSDEACNVNFLGIPTEPYGFSKNYKPTYRKPKFEDCKIIGADNATYTIFLLD